MSPTRDDVARRAGVSVAVVSYVVNGGPRPVAAATRERVLAAIEELGYRPDGVARQLRTGKSNSFGLVVPDLGLPHFGEMTQMLTRLAARQGYQLLVASTEWDLESERTQLSSMADRRVDGVILMSVDPRQDMGWLKTLRVPVVVVDRPTAAVKSSEAAVEHLVWHGHQRIGFVTGSLGVLAIQRRQEGWKAAMRSAGLRLDPNLVVPTEISRQGGYDAAKRLLSQPDPPTGICVDSDAQAVGFLRAAKDVEVAVPGVVGLVSCEGTSTAQFAVPSITTVEVPREEIAAEALAALMGERSDWLRVVSNEGFHLVIRESCGCHTPPNPTR
jgi:LacI family transcriptional regulator